MKPSYQQIAELFGMVPVEAEPEQEQDLELVREEKSLTPTERGKHRMEEGRFLEAIEEFKKAVEESGGANPEALIHLAQSYEVADQPISALMQYRKALRRQPDSSEALLSLGEILKREGRGIKALEELQRAIELEPTNAYLYFKLAEALRNLRRPRAGIDAIQSAILIRPDDAHYHAFAADMHIEVGQFEEAIASLQAAVELSPGDDYLYVRTAIAFWGAGREHDALKALQLASDLDPDNTKLYGLGREFYRAMGDYESEKIWAKRLKELDEFDLDWIQRAKKEARLN